jgi:hypothetical protein
MDHQNIGFNRFMLSSIDPRSPGQKYSYNYEYVKDV